MKGDQTKPRKSYNVKPRPIHYRVASELIKTRGNKRQALLNAGFTEATAKNPQQVTGTKAFQQVMHELGLTDDFLVNSLVHDIENKENRFNELQLGFKLRGHLREQVAENKTLILVTSGESATRYQLPVKGNEE